MIDFDRRTQNLRQPFSGSALVRAPMINGPVQAARPAAMFIHTCPTIILLTDYYHTTLGDIITY
jgi:hypothetical protein